MSDTKKTGKEVLARVIIQMAGAPKDHVEETMKNYIQTLKENDGLDVISEDISDAEENEDKMFSLFSELEINFRTLDHLTSFCIEAMPSSIEILDPETMHITANELSNFFNDMQSKLHTVDLTIKELRAKRKIMNTNMDNLFVNFAKFVLGSGKKTVKDLSPIMGINEESLQKYLDSLVKRKIINMESSEKETYYFI